MADRKNLCTQNNAALPSICPNCRCKVKDFLINNDELITMCINTRCICPFQAKGEMIISKKAQQDIPNHCASSTKTPLAEDDPQRLVGNSHDSAAPSEAFDIDTFFEQKGESWKQEDTKDLSDIIDELLTATGGSTALQNEVMNYTRLS